MIFLLNATCDLVQAVLFIAAALCVIPVILVMTIDMKKLAVQSQVHAACGEQEPLLSADGPDAEIGCPGDRHGKRSFNGHAVMDLEAPFVHKEADLTQGMMLEGMMHENDSAHGGCHPRTFAAGPSAQEVAQDRVTRLSHVNEGGAVDSLDVRIAFQ